MSEPFAEADVAKLRTQADVLRGLLAQERADYLNLAGEMEKHRRATHEMAAMFSKQFVERDAEIAKLRKRLIDARALLALHGIGVVLP